MNEPVLQAFTMTEVCKEVGVDPKTLRRYCQMLNISPAMVSSNGRVKLFSQNQLDNLTNAIQRAYPEKGMRKGRQQREEQNGEHLRIMQPLIGRLFQLEQDLHSLCESMRATPFFSQVSDKTS
jgi:DNA-binding transcriptional MerR regulator